MSNQSASKPLYQWLVQVVGPVLIMFMVGSLVFFLIEVFYRGPHSGRLRWILGLFTMASVLVSRVSIESGRERASLFGFALGIATMITSVQLVQFSGGSLLFAQLFLFTGFIVVVMWSANRLTWDCTVVDRSRDVTAIGLTELLRRKLGAKSRNQNAEPAQMGGQRSAEVGNDTVISDHRLDPRMRGNDPVNTAQSPAKFASESDLDAVARNSNSGNLIQALFAGVGSPNTPGLWVFYFSLAALPVFGIGQWFVPPSPVGGYRWIFFLFSVYLGAALGLLMITSLFGLQRYLNNRGARLPMGVANNWLLSGTLFALIVMVLIMLLPRPNLASTVAGRLAWFGSRPRAPSKIALGRDGAVTRDHGDNHAGSTPRRAQNPGQPEKQDPGELTKANGAQDGNKAAQNAARPGNKDNQAGQPSANTPPNKNDSGSPQKSDSNRRSQSKAAKPGLNQPPEKSSSNSQPGSRQQNDPTSGQTATRERPSDDKSSQNDNDQANENPEQTDRQGKVQDRSQTPQVQPPESSARQANAGTRPPSSAVPNPTSQVAQNLSALVQGILYVVAAIAAVVLGWLFRKELADFWRSLFARKKNQSKSGLPETHQAGTQRKLPDLSRFRNPFASGAANHWPPQRTVVYTFAALEADFCGEPESFLFGGVLAEG